MGLFKYPIANLAAELSLSLRNSESARILYSGRGRRAKWKAEKQEFSNFTIDVGLKKELYIAQPSFV